MSSPLDKNELPPSSRLSRLKAQFQQKQMQEKEHKLLQMLDNQQQRAMQKATINGVLPSKYSNNGYSSTLSTPSNNSYTNYSSTGPGKVRQMFEERRKGGGGGGLYNSNNSNGNNTNGPQGYRNGGFVGIDKGYPLDPIVTPTPKNRSSSSKSDPNPTNTNSNTNTHSRNGRSNLTSKPPSNMGVNKRGLSLDRNGGGGGGSERTTPVARSRDSNSRDLASSFSSNGNGPIGGGGGGGAGVGLVSGMGLRRASSGLTSFDNEVSSNNISNRSNNHSSTKYGDVYRGSSPLDGSDSIAKRENSLAMKMKNMNIYDSKPSSTESNNKAPSPSHRSASPVKRTPVAPPMRVMASSNVKPFAPKKTATNKPPARSGPPPPGTEECKICGRFFASDRLEKHQTICKKTSTKKRKVFDPTKMRMQGTEAEPYIRRVSAKVNKNVPSPTKGDGSLKKSDWRKKHEEFIKTIRAAKVYQAHVDAGGNPADLPPPPPADTSDYVQCPYCNRKFSEGVAERHIPKCKNIKSNKRR